jgi:hypothetical protein
MKTKRCVVCGLEFPEDELLQRENDGQFVCEDCSGLLSNEDLSCSYDETG